MSIYEALPQVEQPRELRDDELTKFTNANIWPAAIYFWGNSFRNPKDLDENDPVHQMFESPDGRRKVEVSFYIDAEFPLNDAGEVDENVETDLFAGVCLEAYHPDLTSRFQKRTGQDLEIWEVITYDFPLDGTTPIANRYYSFRDEESEEIESDKVTKRQNKFLRNISRLPQFDPDRSIELDTQDIIDIHNLLLALEVPNGIINMVGTTGASETE
jgi:hypothetical protein